MLLYSVLLLFVLRAWATLKLHLLSWKPKAVYEVMIIYRVRSIKIFRTSQTTLTSAERAVQRRCNIILHETQPCRCMRQNLCEIVDVLQMAILPLCCACKRLHARVSPSRSPTWTERRPGWCVYLGWIELWYIVVLCTEVQVWTNNTFANVVLSPLWINQGKRLKL